MKNRLLYETSLCVVSSMLGYLIGASKAAGVFSTQAFQISFGIAAGGLLAIIAGGIAIDVMERRRTGEFKKRVRITLGPDTTTLIVEPKEKGP